MTDSTSHSTNDLLKRISDLELQLRTQTEKLAALTLKQNQTTSQEIKTSSFPNRPTKPFDPSSFSTRHVALKLSYIGSRYQGYEHANGNVQPKPTIEEVLWKALRKSRLISPKIEDGADDGVEVIWEPEIRSNTYFTNGWGHGQDDGKNKKLRLDLNWDGCQYSKCGRTDRGVSAFGQVIGIRLRSNRPLNEKTKRVDDRIGENGYGGIHDQGVEESSMNGDLDGEMPSIEVDDLVTDTYAPTFHPINDELPYLSILNTILPPDIRILAWCPDPPSNFDARFSCRERRYKYFFTNPALCPTPGSLGLKRANGSNAELRTGWLDIEKMRLAAKKLEGLHDFRNFCKVDAAKQMPSCERRITFADIQEVEPVGMAFQSENDLSSGQKAGVMSMAQTLLNNTNSSSSIGPQTFAFAVHGSAFLWHQVRCMVAILFLVGQGLEEPNIIDDLLDVQQVRGKPMYEMADETPLVLWDCIFPDDEGEVEDALNWIYVGDERTIPALATKTDGKFGTGGLVDGLWEQWRKIKMDEILAGRLLDLTISQGDKTAFTRGGVRNPDFPVIRSQKIFHGSESPRMVGEYKPILKRSRMDSLEVLNGKYAAGKLARRNAKRELELETNGD